MHHFCIKIICFITLSERIRFYYDGIMAEDRLFSLSIQERKPDVTSEIMAFRDYLLSSTVSDTLDVWELKGFHALRFLLL